MNRCSVLPVAALAATGALLAAAAMPPGQADRNKVTGKSTATTKKDTFSEIAPLVMKYCSGCHGTKVTTAGIAVDKFHSTSDVLKGRDVWEKISKNVAGGTMPPKGMPEPTPAEREKIASWIDRTLSQADCDIKDPGRVTLRRLNREEYNNTLRDLLGVTVRPADDFPSDDVGYGFDNIGDVLSISPLLMEKYLSAAEKVSRAAIYIPGIPKSAAVYKGSDIGSDSGYKADDQGDVVLSSNGEVHADHTFPKDDTYYLRVRAYGDQAGKEPAKMAVRLDGKDLQTIDVPVVKETARYYDVKTRVLTGKHRVSVAFLNDLYQPNAPNPNDRDRNLIVQRIEVSIPISEQSADLPASHKRLIPEEPAKGQEDAAARKSLTRLATHAFRRPATQQEVNRLVRIVQAVRKDGESYDKGMQLALQAVLVSPHFLFKVELDREPNNPKASHAISDYEMASRLSYFLWSSMPDDELLGLAAKHTLNQPKVVEAQVKRMLADPKSNALVQNFAGQWLTLRNLNLVAPDRGKFRTFNPQLRDAMKKETDLFVAYIMQQDRSVLEFLDARYTFVNDRLAKHYGIEGVDGTDFRKVDLTDERRGGLVTQASILTLTSNPTRTSPVKRGKWVLEQILGTPPPPPPPGVPALREEGRMATGTLRQRLEQHRKDPGCASCHSRLDPMGFGLENFDPIGAWREKEGNAPVDASGTLPGGVTFTGPAELKKVLLSQKDQFIKSLSERLLTYALGRGLENFDRCATQNIAQTVKKSGYRFSSLVTEIVRSEPFRMRRGDGGTGK